MRTSQFIFASFFSTLLVPAVTFADEAQRLPEPVSPNALAPQAAPTPVADPVPTVVAKAPTPPLPIAPIAVGGHTCHVGDYESAGLDFGNARTIADLICNELAQKRAPVGAYDVGYGKLGGKVLLSLSNRESGQRRRLFIQGPEESTVAVPRLVDALVTNKTLNETETVDNVVVADTRKPKTKPISPSVSLGIVGMAASGADVGSGIDMGVFFRSQSIAVGGHGRAGGIGSAENTIGFSGLDLGARYYPSDSDAVAPFLGGGMGFAYLHVPDADYTKDRDGSGFDFYGEAGLEFFRASQVGANVSLRVDAPVFKLRSPESYSYDGTITPPSEKYVLPVSLNIGVSFH